jgi:hypothetical protein
MVDMIFERSQVSGPGLGFRMALPRLGPSTPQAAGLDPQRHQLLLRFALVNVAALALLAAAYGQGHLDRIVATDDTGLCVAIFLVFASGLAIAAQRAWQISSELACLRHTCPPEVSEVGRYLARIGSAPAESRSLLASSLRLRLTARIATVRLVANSLVLLGLIGTVIGFIVALSGVDPEQVGDASSIAPMVSTLIQGMSVALYTTLVGAVLNIWLTVNYHLLAGATIKLLAGLVDQGESDGRA